MNSQTLLNIAKITGRFIILVLAQVFVFDKINLGGYLDPYIYLMFILLLPFETPQWLVLISSFAIGLAIDLFTGSLGVHAAASTFTAFVRPAVVQNLFPKPDKSSVFLPGINDMGIAPFLLYTLILVFIQNLILFSLEAFRFSETGSVLLRTLLSTILTSVLIVMLDLVFKKTPKQ